MAEIVNEMQERLMPEYEQLKQLDILNEQQLRECIRKRENLQYKITQAGQSIVCYLEFIAYEKKMHLLVTEKEKFLGIKAAGLKSAIATRIIKLYREGLRKYPHDVRFWQHFINFSKKSVPNEVTGIYEKMLTFHGDKPELWVDAAVWTYEYGKNMPRVRDILLRGLQRHEDSEALHKCLFDILLNEATKMSTKRNLQENTISEQEIGLSRVEAVYRNSKKHIKNIEYFITLLERCEESQYVEITPKLQRLILDDMREEFPRDELLWDTLAQRELRGWSLNDLQDIEKTQLENAENIAKELNAKEEITEQDSGNEEEKLENENENDVTIKTEEKQKKVPTQSIWKKRTLEQRIELCCSIYKEAVNVLKTTRMWTFYINAMLALNQDMSTQAPLKRKCLAVAFKTGHESHLMSLEHYTTFRDMLLETPNGIEKATRLLNEALPYQKSIEFYELLLDVYIADNDEPKVYDLFKRAQKKFEYESHPIWLRVIRFYKNDSNPESVAKLKAIYREACIKPHINFIPLRCDYLQYCHDTSGIAAAREAYAELLKMPPQNLEFHQKMAALEADSNEKSPADLQHWRKCYEYMVCYFGTTNHEVWLDFVRFERDHGDMKLITNLFQRAKSALRPKDLEHFITKFQLEQCAQSV